MQNWGCWALQNVHLRADIVRHLAGQQSFLWHTTIAVLSVKESRGWGKNDALILVQIKGCKFNELVATASVVIGHRSCTHAMSHGASCWRGPLAAGPPAPPAAAPGGMRWYTAATPTCKAAPAAQLVASRLCKTRLDSTRLD